MRRSAFAAIFLSAIFFAGCGPKTETLSLLVWEGYADPSFLKAFEDAHHCKVVASYMGSSDELVAKLRGGSAGNYDVISPSSDVATSIVKAGLAAPLDLSKIPAYPQLSARVARISAGQSERPDLRRPVCVGTESAALRHECISEGTRQLERSLGSQIERQNLAVG